VAFTDHFLPVRQFWATRGAGGREAGRACLGGTSRGRSPTTR